MPRTSSLLIAVCLGLVTNAFSINKFAIHGSYMEPYGKDAKDYGEGGFGWGVHLITSVPKPFDILGGVAGFDNVLLLAHTTEYYDNLIGMRVEQRTRQRYTRLFVGAEIGAHGHGFFRPHVGANVAVVNYGYSLSAHVPDDESQDDIISNDLDEEDHWAFGQDLNGGVDFRFKGGFSVDTGARWLKTYSVPQSLGRDSKKVSPEYFQIYLALGYGFDWSAIK